MRKVFIVVKIGKDSFRVLFTRSTREKAENALKEYLAPDLLETVTCTILEAWTNSTPKPDEDHN